ncbi:MAG: hypothetical protein WC901_01190 [Candidatus Margulisiibacteriota bacterium]
MLFGLCLGLFLIFVLGWGIVWLLDRARVLRGMEKLAISFLLGQIGTTLLFFGFLVFRLPQPAFGEALLLGTLSLLIIFFERKNILAGILRIVPAIKQGLVWRPFNGATFKRWLLVILLLLIGLKLAYALVETGSKPEYAWDASGNWTACGKGLYYVTLEQPSRLPQFWASQGNNYPKHVSLMHGWLFSLMQQANDQWSKIFFWLNLLCLVMIFYQTVSATGTRWRALFFTYFLLSGPYFIYMSTIGYADFTLMVYFSVGIVYFYQWVRTKQETYFYLFSLFLAATTWIKLEGKPYAVLGMILVGLFVWLDKSYALKAKCIKTAQYIGAGLIIGLPWQCFALAQPWGSRERLALHLPQALELLRLIYGKMFIEGTWGIFWIIAIAGVLLSWRKIKRREILALAVAVLLFFAVLLSIFLFTEDALGWFEVSFNRILLSVYPVVVLLLSLL